MSKKLISGKNLKYKSSNIQRQFNFMNFGNLYYYPGFSTNFFYFNSLMSNYERNPPNPMYAQKAHIIGSGALTKLSNIPGIGTQQEAKNTFLLDQITQILSILNLAVEQERANELKFIDDKIAMLRNSIDPKYYKKNQDLAAIEHLLSQLKSDDGSINYMALIALLNTIEQGFENSKGIFEFEMQHLLDLDVAVKKNRAALENQIRGLMKTERFRNKPLEDQETIVQKALEKRNRIRVNAYLKQGHLKNIPSFKKYMAKMTTADYKIADWISKEVQNVLDNNYKLWANLIQANNLTRNGYQTLTEQIRSTIINSVAAFAADHQAEILKDALDKLNVDGFCNELINSYNISINTQINNVPEDFGIQENKLKLFQERIAGNLNTFHSAEGIYQALEEVMTKMKRKSQDSYTPEEQLIDATLGKNTVTNFYEDTIEPVNNLIKQFERIIELENKNKAAVTINRNNETRDLEATIVIDGEKTIKWNLSEQFSQAHLNLYQRNNVPKTFKNIVTNMKRAAGKKIRDEVVNIISATHSQAAHDLERDMAHALQQIKVVVKGPDISEILQGFDKTWSIKLWTGQDLVKNDVIEIVVGMPNGRQTSMTINNLLKNNLDAINFSKYNKHFFQGYSDVFQEFQSQFQQAIQKDMVETRNSKEFTKYDAMAKRFFETQKIKEEMIQKIENLYGEYEQELSNKIKDEKKRDAAIKNIRDAAMKFISSIKETLYVSSTMKTYSTYQNDLGFTGGSLGANIDSQIDSFDQIFSAAGIPIEPSLKEWLKFAILNCSSVSVIGERNKDFIENYLGGLAVFALFNEGGAELQLLAQQLPNQELITTNNVMHLYRLNGVYYPGSFVLKQVINNLNAVSEQINQIKSLSANKNIMIYNPASYSMLPNGKNSKQQNVTDPWGQVGSEVSSGVKIKVLFLAGLLDVVKGLHAQMNFELPT